MEVINSGRKKNLLNSSSIGIACKSCADAWYSYISRGRYANKTPPRSGLSLCDVVPYFTHPARVQNLSRQLSLEKEKNALCPSCRKTIKRYRGLGITSFEAVPDWSTFFRVYMQSRNIPRRMETKNKKDRRAACRWDRQGYQQGMHAWHQLQQHEKTIRTGTYCGGDSKSQRQTGQRKNPDNKRGGFPVKHQRTEHISFPEYRNSRACTKKTLTFLYECICWICLF